MRILSMIAALGLIGCVGDVGSGSGDDAADDPTDPTNPDNPDPDVQNSAAAAAAKKLYEDNIYPIVAGKCVACHSANGPVTNSTGFVGIDVASAYTTVKGYTAAIGDLTIGGTPIVTKITVEKNPTHAGFTYDDVELGKFTEWLAKELEAKVPGGVDPTQPAGESPAAATARVMKEWSGCMTLANFNAANMTAWGNIQADGSNCRTCHNEGVYGYIASNQANPNFFKYITEDKYYMLQYFSVDLSLGPALAKMKINTKSFEGVGLGIAPHQSHPRFNPTNNNGMTALKKYFDTTMALKVAGTCEPARLLN